jgi:hypothetical protein
MALPVRCLSLQLRGCAGRGGLGLGLGLGSVRWPGLWRARAARALNGTASGAGGAGAGGGAGGASSGLGAGAAGEGWSLRWRLFFFGSFVSGGSVASLSYVLATDETQLLWVQSRWPWVVSLLAPWLGLPVVEETGRLDEEAYFPRDISDLVGESVRAACVLRSGRVIVVSVPSSGSQESLLSAASAHCSLSEDPLVKVVFVDASEEQALVSAGGRDSMLAVELAAIPVTASRAELSRLLDVYRVRELEFRTQEALGRKHGYDVSHFSRALLAVESGKKELKRRLKQLF